MAQYPFEQIERKWQANWDDKQIFKTSESQDKPKYYILDMFPYPSGAGLHIGHPEGYTATDILSRYKRMSGYNVLHPMGFDAFGLPTERYSMQTGIHPEIATKKNIENFVRQLKMFGFDYDWTRQINTTSPEYYKWTQWIFLLIYNSWYDHNLKKSRPIIELEIPTSITSQKEIDEYIDSKRLAYISFMPVNWCEQLGTVLANEEVDEWREKGYTVERRPMRQWMLRITEYADRLMDDLSLVEWPSSTIEMQRHWIGKSEGAEIDFKIDGSSEKIRIFTTRPDTIFGATYMVLAPEHPLVSSISTESQKERVEKYQTDTNQKSDQQRGELNKDKSGVFTGAYAINPANEEKIPILIADYVLMGYGTGAIMAVPGHDQRDHEFAKALEMKIIQVVAPEAGNIDLDIQNEAFTEYGVAVNSSSSKIDINGLKTIDAKSKMIEWLETEKIGEKKIQFRLRDWLFSRQRYWGEPMPIMFFEDGTKRGLDFDELPLVLPEVKDFKPAGTGESPLATVENWVNFIDKKTGKKARYETNTMPQWAGSCWYYLRYTDPNNPNSFIDKSKESYWMGESGVDLYMGGAEHAVLHLLYARFWHKILFDYGYVSTPEPFNRLFHQGLILGLSYRKKGMKENVFIPNDLVEARDESFFHKETGEELEELPAKMSKSLKNVVNPDELISEYGADSVRVFEMFLGPLEAAKPWQSKGIEGVHRFLGRVWRMIVNEDGTLQSTIQDISPNKEQEFILHTTIKKIDEDINNLSFNTAISQMMIFINEMYKFEIKPKSVVEDFLKCLSPFAPHITEELWQIMGNSTFLSIQEFPKWDLAKTVKNDIELVVQVTSKIRGRISASKGISQEEALRLALADENVARFIGENPVKKVIFVADKLINIIV